MGHTHYFSLAQSAVADSVQREKIYRSIKEFLSSYVGHGSVPTDVIYSSTVVEFVLIWLDGSRRETVLACSIACFKSVSVCAFQTYNLMTICFISQIYLNRKMSTA